MFFDNLPRHNRIGAHRGARSLAPENTILSMTKAWELGSHFWETDIQISKDGELILFHDATLERTTNIATHPLFQQQKDYHVDQFTINELHTLDAGSWFLSNDPYHTVANGETTAKEVIKGQKIPLLQEVLLFSKKHSFPVNLELKTLDTPSADATFVDKIISIILETNTRELVLLSSFNHEYLQRVHNLQSDIPTAVLAAKRHPVDLVEYLKSLSAVAYHPDVSMCDSALLSHLQEHGFQVNTWTVNTPQQAREMHHLGAGIITDWPQRIISQSQGEANET